MKRLLSIAAKAAVLPCLAFTALVGSSAPAQAAACTDYIFLQDLINAGGTCRQAGAAGPVLFTYINHSGPFNAADTVFTTSGTGINNVTFGLAYNTTPFGPGAYTFDYSLTHDTKYFSAISNTLSSSLNLNANGAIYSVNSTVSAANLSASYATGGVITNGLYTYSSPSLLTETFNTALNVTTGGIENFSATYQFVTPPPPPATTPGPLPLLGAGAAFGFSRKIRSKIKTNAA